MRRDRVLFVDTNVLLTATDESRRDHAAASALFQAATQYAHLAVSGQVVREYLVVATRPLEVNGLGLSGLDALANVEEFRRRTLFLAETEDVADRLADILRARRVFGKRIHDANVVATMVAYGVSDLITANTDDFRAFKEVHVHSLETAATWM